MPAGYCASPGEHCSHAPGARTVVHDEPQMPFGGVKAPGWGRFGGHFAHAEFTDLRWLTVQEGERHYPI